MCVCVGGGGGGGHGGIPSSGIRGGGQEDGIAMIYCAQIGGGGAQWGAMNYFSFQSVVHYWCNKGIGMCYPLCGILI